MSAGDMHWTELARQAHELDAGTFPHDPYPDGPDGVEWREDDRDEIVKAACETFHGHGFGDDELGDVDGFGHFYRVSRWTVETDTRGFSTVTEHGSEEEAIAWWATLEEEWREFCGPDDEDAVMTDLPSGGYSVSFAGRHLGNFDRDGAERAIRETMEREQYWPDVWVVSDHGNHQRISLAPESGS
jgi:hypothetical protein